MKKIILILFLIPSIFLLTACSKPSLSKFIEVEDVDGRLFVVGTKKAGGGIIESLDLEEQNDEYFKYIKDNVDKKATISYFISRSKREEFVYFEDGLVNTEELIIYNLKIEETINLTTVEKNILMIKISMVANFHIELYTNLDFPAFDPASRD